MIDRRPQAGRVEGMAVAGRERGAEADVFRHGSHIGEQRDRIVLRGLHRVAQRRLHRCPVGVGDVVEVGEEDHVETAALAQAGDVLIELGAVPGIAGMIRQRMPPHGEAMVGGPMHQELGEVDLPLACAPHAGVLNVALLGLLGNGRECANSQPVVQICPGICGCRYCPKFEETQPAAGEETVGQTRMRRARASFREDRMQRSIACTVAAA